MKVNYWQSLEYDCHYHIYNRSVNGEKLFSDEKDYTFFLKKYKEYISPYFDTLAYCLIPNHFHFIIRVKLKDEINEVVGEEKTNAAEKLLADSITINQFISDQFRRYFSSYSIRYNHKYLRTGPIFSPRVKRVFIENDDRLRYLIAYVHHNPIHHDLSANFNDWKYSSFRAFLTEGNTSISRKCGLDLFGGKEDFLKLHGEFQLEKTEDV